MSGLERGGSVRFLTLTSSPDAPADIEKSWRALYMRLKRRGLITGYIKVPEFTKEGRMHVHILFRGSYVAQALLSAWWADIHKSPVVDIRSFRPYTGKKRTASYMAKYMAKEGAGRCSWSWGWVWRGFVGDWQRLKRFWSKLPFYNEPRSYAWLLSQWACWLKVGKPPGFMEYAPLQESP
jgi:hypothetical protein